MGPATAKHALGIVSELEGAIRLTPTGRLRILDEQALKTHIDRLAQDSALTEGAAQGVARWLVAECAEALGIRLASIHDLYMARGRGETRTDFTVPAMNLRALTFDAARAAFQAAARLDAGAFIFEIARSEMSYTFQRPIEYTTSILAAAIKEGYRGPVFVQGDHFQISAQRYGADPVTERRAVEDLTSEALAAGFYNIDIDTSTLVDLSKSAIVDQQAQNYRVCAELTAFIRGHQAAGVTVSVGGEIGEVGGHNSNEAELRAFMDGYQAELLEQSLDGRRRRDLPGISKISIQTGTSHGGVVLADGSIADVAVDFETLRRLSHVARTEYGLAGAVQHGASTLPDSAFRRFAECGACEVHLATNFQTLLFKRLPADLQDAVTDWLRTHAANERKPSDSDEQFFYKTRKKAIGPFKPQMWGLPDAIRAGFREAWAQQMGFLFEQLNIAGTRALVGKHVSAPARMLKREDFLGVDASAEDVEGLAD